MNFEYTKQTLETRKELLSKAQKQYDEITAKINAAEAGAAGAREVVAETEKLRNERKSLFASLLSMGKTVFEGGKVKELDNAIAAKRDDADRAADILAAQSELLERLHSERVELAHKMNKLSELLLISQHEMFVAEMEQTHIPEYLKAAEEFARASAKLAGYGKAAAIMCSNLHEKGIRTATHVYGNLIPAHTVDLRIDSFNFQKREDGSYIGVFDVSEQIEQYSNEAMENAQKSISTH